MMPELIFYILAPVILGTFVIWFWRMFLSLVFSGFMALIAFLRGIS